MLECGDVEGSRKGMWLGELPVRLFAILGCGVSLALAACALDGCYRCDSPGEPRCPNVEPSYPPPTPFSAPRDAGRE